MSSVPSVSGQRSSFCRDFAYARSSYYVPRTPEEADLFWKMAVLFYKKVRQHWESTTVQNIEKILKMLDGEAEKLYRLADRLERDPATIVDVQPLDVIRSRLAKRGIAAAYVETALRFVAKQAPVGVPPTPADLRRLATTVLTTNAKRRESFGTYLSALKKVRSKSGRGRYPSLALEYLLDFATMLEIGDAELARRMTAEGIEPEYQGTDEPDVTVRWAVVIKAARARRRRRDR